jgi:hypothetical protein
MANFLIINKSNNNIAFNGLYFVPISKKGETLKRCLIQPSVVSFPLPLLVERKWLEKKKGNIFEPCKSSS